MKMQLFVSCLALLSVMLHCVLAASAVNVGLYAPDRYNGIPETCLLPMDFGYCRAKVKRYYFDMRRMKCAMFYFGGCAGNVNNFKTLEECNQACLDGYGDYDSPNDVAVGNKVNGREYKTRINHNANYNAINAQSSRGSVTNTNSNSGGNNIKNHTSATSFGASTSGGVETAYKNTFSKYNSNNYNTNTGSSIINLHNSGSGSGSTSIGASANNNTKILRSRSDDNLEEYDYEEEN